MRGIIGLAAGPLLAAAAHSESFPAKPVTTIVPWPAGGNRPGGSGMNGPATMAKTAKPDHHRARRVAAQVEEAP